MSKLTVFIIGITVGIASQHVSQIRAYTNETVHKMEIPIQYKTNLPNSFFYMERQGYSLAYDARNRNPAWVYEHLTSEGINGNTDRSQSIFKEDESIPEILRATLADYKGSGFDRGHQAPAANHKSSKEAMSDTFYLSNMCPQCPAFNRGYWARFEKYVRDLTKHYPNVYVVTGPLYLSHQEANGKRYVKYQVVGSNEVAVPTHFFKLITLEDALGRKEAIAYVLPNREIPSSTPLDSFKTTVEKVQKAAGFILPH